MDKRHNAVLSLLRHKRFYAIMFMVILIVTSMISSDTDVAKAKVNNGDHRPDFAAYKPTNPHSKLYIDSGNHFVSLGSDSEYYSKQVRSSIEAEDGVFFIAIKPDTNKSYHVIPQELLPKNGSCISNFDFIDISGMGLKQWVFRCDLKNAALIITLLAVPLSFIDELFHEIENNIPARYPLPILKQKKIRKKIRGFTFSKIERNSVSI